MRSSSRIAGVAGLAVMLAPAAFGGESRIVFEASVDHGRSWHREVTTGPGAEVSIRMRFVYESTSTVLGFGGITMQPTVRGWSAGDRVLPFDFDLASDAPESAYGLVYPFARFRSGLPGPIDPPIPEPRRDWIGVDNGAGELRLMQRGGLANPDLSWGLSFSQSPPSLNTIFSTSMDLIAFRYGFVVDGGERTMIASAPLQYINNARMVWHTTSGGTSPRLISLAEEDVVGAVVHVVPGPGAMVVVLAGVGMVRRRRRAG